MNEREIADETEHLSRFRGRVNGSIVAKVGFGEKVFMAAFLGLAGIAVALLAFICAAVWEANGDNRALESAFREYAQATNRRLDTLERLVLEDE